MDKLYTIEETMSLLKVSRAGLYRLMSSGKLKHVKLGGRTLIKESELSRFIDSLGGEETV
jgi:excisionase family DNA binding protein